MLQSHQDTIYYQTRYNLRQRYLCEDHVVCHPIMHDWESYQQKCSFLLFWWQVSERLALGWGAAILGYVSAVHWGLALAGRWPWTAGVVLGSTLPSVLAAAAVLIGEVRGLALLVVGFGLFWLYEHRYHQQDLPADYLALRRNLSLTVCVLLAMTAIALDNARMLS